MAESETGRRELAAAIADSFRRRTGRDLVESTDVGVDEALMTASAVILCHDGGADPQFVYANHAAARLWRMSIDEIIGLPSRLTASAEHRAERGRTLDKAASSGLLSGYTGERIAADGTRFMIEGATLWTVDFPDGSQGQAVVFDTWSELPHPSDPAHVR